MVGLDAARLPSHIAAQGRAGAMDGLNGESEAVACSSSWLPLAQSLIALSRHVLPSITATRA